MWAVGSEAVSHRVSSAGTKNIKWNLLFPTKSFAEECMRPERMAGSKVPEAATKMTTTPNSEKPYKRKRDLDGSQATTPTKKKKKRDSLAAASPEDDASTNKKRKRAKNALQGEDYQESAGKESTIATERSEKTPADKDDIGHKDGKKSKDGKRKSSKKLDTKSDENPTVTPEADAMDIEEEEEAEDKDEGKTSKNKHAGILSKFERTKEAASKKSKRKSKKEEDGDDSMEDAVEPVIAQGLEPLPQPENPPELEEAPTYSSLPAWLANPTRKSADERRKFSELGIKPDLLRILQQHQYSEAFAVQSTVIPLLLDGNKNHPGDLCISAATGSGKTLSYVLPLVTSLSSRPASKLRGLIVVPTRELVKQAREACELVAAGSRLHIGSAVGNVAIKDEQKLLMRVDQVYNPATVAQRQKAGIQGNDWMDFSLEDCVTEAVDSTGFLPGYIQRPEPNVDILICTPGRLVDHIRYTKGFTLKNLEWLVIDEADRLLNESFQEWVDVVMSSLDSRQSPDNFGPGGKLLSDLGLPIETKPPRKVVLSATMTRDISKLNSLRLANPKMVIIGAENAMDLGDPSATHPDAHFTLPPTLHEHMLPVGDGSQKPLYLLRLLLSHIKIGVDDKKRIDRPSRESSSDTSSDDTSSDESSDDDTSSSGSDSDSDTSSDTSSDASSDSEDSESDSVDPVVEAQTSRTTVLIFTKSSESASRLARLISLLHPSLANRMGTIIKSNKSSSSRKTLAAFRQGRVSVIVATDRASRGLDLPSLTHVVNYDMPTSVTTYVHRVGRTARAGREGSAWTLVAHREGRWFSNEISASVDGRITRIMGVDRTHVKPADVKEFQSKYAAALDVLEREVKVGKGPKSRPLKVVKA
ncbi:hypothetical protein N7478_012586 [Penicillium angulare]|uniref:uncharacterized protein n=1 Tax=Penicillium angulare TaxID=116970 RepID=UPI002541D30B|nr:uncharacterized protein N7478_012586 [Penicillium angulare]KAJ5259605.1 hypothetical protein N7478_012586 [Penicillium angulare]